MKGRTSTGTLIAVAIAAVLVVGASRQVIVGERAMRQADVARRSGDVRSQIAYARAAAEALLPGSPYPRRGFERLAQIARDAEARGDGPIATSAWRAVRAAALETRALGTGTDGWLADANDGLVRLAAKETPAPSIEADLAAPIGPTSWELLLLAAIPFALYAATSRFLRARKARPIP